MALTIYGRNPNFVAAYTAAVKALMEAQRHVFGFWPVPKPKYPTISPLPLEWALRDGAKRPFLRYKLPARAFAQQNSIVQAINELGALALDPKATPGDVEYWANSHASLIDESVRTVRAGGARQGGGSLYGPRVATYSFLSEYVRRLDWLTSVIERSLSGEATAYVLAAVEMTNAVLSPWRTEDIEAVRTLEYYSDVITRNLQALPSPVFAEEIEYLDEEWYYSYAPYTVPVGLYNVRLDDSFDSTHAYRIREVPESLARSVIVLEQKERVAYGLSRSQLAAIFSDQWNAILSRRGLFREIPTIRGVL